MKVVHIDTERGWRGGERQAFWLARELGRRGHEAWMACRPHEPLAHACREANIGLFPLRPWSEFDVLSAGKLARFVRERGDCVLHAHTAHAVGLAAGAKRLFGIRAPLVATRRVDFSIGVGPFSRWKYASVDAFVAISRKVREKILESGFPENKISLIPSGISIDGYPSAADKIRLRREKGYRPEDRIIVNVAALVPHKDQATLLSAFRQVADQVPSARLLIIGDGALRRVLTEQSRRLGIDGRTEFLGFRQDALSYIALADVFVLSSVEEGLGTSILDAMAIGVPTVATRAGGIPDAYGTDQTPELVPPREPAALAKALVDLLTNPQEVESRVRRGKERAGEFTVARMTDRYEELYSMLRAVR